MLRRILFDFCGHERLHVMPMYTCTHSKQQGAPWNEAAWHSRRHRCCRTVSVHTSTSCQLAVWSCLVEVWTVCRRSSPVNTTHERSLFSDAFISIARCPCSALYTLCSWQVSDQYVFSSTPGNFTVLSHHCFCLLHIEYL